MKKIKFVPMPPPPFIAPMPVHVITICGKAVTLSGDVYAVVDQLHSVDGIDADYVGYCATINVTTCSIATIAETASIKDALDGLYLEASYSHPSNTTAKVKFAVRAASMVLCPNCNYKVTLGAFEQHQDSPECLVAIAATAAGAAGLITTSGTAIKVLDRSELRTTHVLSSISAGVDAKGRPLETGSMDYIKLYPDWAIRVANVTIVSFPLRKAVIEHCQEHAAARAALQAALRLGPGHIKAFAHKKSDTEQAKQNKKLERKKFTDLFNQVLETTGDIE